MIDEGYERLRSGTMTMTADEAMERMEREDHSAPHVRETCSRCRRLATIDALRATVTYPATVCTCAGSPAVQHVGTSPSGVPLFGPVRCDYCVERSQAGAP